MEIPLDSLSQDALLAVLEDVVTRDGTHVGESDEGSLEEKVKRLHLALKRGEAVLTFDAETETVGVEPRR